MSFVKNKIDMEKKILQIEGITATEFLQKIESLEKAIHELRKKQVDDSKPETNMTIDEVAQYFNISKVTVHTWTKKGILKAYKIGNKVYYKHAEINKALNPKK